MSSEQKLIVAGFDVTAIDQRLKKIEPLHQLAVKANVPEFYIASGALGALALILLVSFGLGPVTDLVGFVYPVYCSFKALSTDGKDDDKQWLSYWTVYGFLNVAESFFFLATFIPMYSIVKLAVLSFCMYNNGAIRVYSVVIEPVMKKYESVIDETLENAKKGVAQAASEAVSAVKAKVVEVTPGDKVDKEQ